MCSESQCSLNEHIVPTVLILYATVLVNALVSWQFDHFTSGSCYEQSTYRLGLKRVLGYSYSGRYQTSTRYCRPTRVLGIYNDRRKSCCKVACGDYFKAYTSRPPLSLLLCSTYLQYLRSRYFIEYAHVHTYFFTISPTKHTKNVLAGSSAVLIRDEIHCKEYPGTRRVMSVGYPGSNFSTRFNPNTDTDNHSEPYPKRQVIMYSICALLSQCTMN